MPKHRLSCSCCLMIAIGFPLLVLSGCSGSDSPDSQSDPRADSAAADPDRCEKKLAAAIQRLQPQSMATQSRTDLVVNSLNSWLTECANDRVNALSPGNETRELLSTAADRYASAGRFTLNDATYIRDCLLLRGLTEQVWKRADEGSATGIATESDRVTALFDAVHQMVTLLPADSERVAVGLYEVMLTGRGTVDDRIWLFAEALRQRQIDAVVLTCADNQRVNDAAGSVHPLLGANQLVAVLAQPEILLFDPLRVTPVFALDDPARTAGLTDLVNSDRWKTAKVQLVAQPAIAAVRMLVLQENLKAEDAAMLYDELAGGPGEMIPLRDRVLQALKSNWSPESITVWNWPEQQVAASSALTEEERQIYTRLMKPFDAPFERDPLKTGDSLDEIDVNQEGLSEQEKFQLMQQKLQERLERMNESSEEMFGKASKRLLKVRIEQVMGNSDLNVIQQLQQIRIASMHDYVEIQVLVGPEQTGVVQVPLPDAIRAIHQSATGDALYWSALCQIDRGDDGAAVITLRNYRTQYPDGAQFDASLIQEALAMMRIGGMENSLELLRGINLDSTPERRRVEWLLAQFDPAETEAATATEGEPASGDDSPAANESPADAPQAQSDSGATDQSTSDEPAAESGSDQNPAN